jgi:thiamine-monophosphate kinase
MAPLMRSEALGPGGEFDLIREFVRNAPHNEEVLVGPGDDCVVLAGGIVLSCDASVEGVHFRRDWLLPEEIGYRSVATALSDLAAMAATPIAILTSLALPQSDYGEFALKTMTGARRAAAAAGAALAGGDTTSTDGPLLLDVVVVGKAERPVLRSGARAGDRVFVTGELGGAAAAVADWLRGEPPHAGARRRYALPEPRIREALWLAQRVDLHALIDLSDGLGSDAAHIAAASGRALTLWLRQLPVHPAAAGRPQLALAGGDDYELCFTANAQDVAAVALEFFEFFGTPITDVGEVAEGSGVRIMNEAGEVLEAPPRGWDHFGGHA